MNENVNERTGGQGGSAMAVMCVDEWINKMGVRWMVAV